MGFALDQELVQWLDDGQRVVTASERTARAMAAAYHQVRRARGESAWPSPRIEPWAQFVRHAWKELGADARMVLDAAQEQALWAAVVAAEGELTTALEASRARLGTMAMEAHTLLAGHAPAALRAKARAGWQGDQEAFSRWLGAFDAECQRNSLLSSARLPLELLSLLEQTESSAREPLLLAGFDRLQLVQRRMLEAWGSWREVAPGGVAAQPGFYAATDESEELTACVLWCRAELERNPTARILLVCQSLARDRGRIERAFLEHGGAAGGSLYEFSLGVALAATALARNALLVLRWLTDPLEEHALDGLIASGHMTADAAEQAALARRMRRLRERGRQRSEWTLEAFLTERCDTAIPPAWQHRMTEAHALLATRNHRQQSPLGWAEFVPRLLTATGWPGGRALSSAEYQIYGRFAEALDGCASMSFVQRRMGWSNFVQLLARVLQETLYAPESTAAPVLVAGPTETAGLTADAAWFLGATEDMWPAAGSTHPFLPLGLQRETGMPHAHPRIDWELAKTVTQRLLRSAERIQFSYPRQREDVEMLPSRLVLHTAGAAVPLPARLRAAAHPQPVTGICEDASRIPYPAGGVAGGSELITNQSLCPFRAFASARLGAKEWDAAEAGLTAAQRGTLLHAVLHAAWGGPPYGIRSQSELLALMDRAAFVREHVERVFPGSLPSGAGERMPRRYLELEKQRLATLVTEWLEYEATRVPFVVEATEDQAAPSLHELALRLRLDRIDRLKDGTALVVDYKTGDVKPKLWDGERAEDLQLPLYAAYGLGTGEELGGLVFARVRAGEMSFAGRVSKAQETLLPGLNGTNALVKQPLTKEMLKSWRDKIERLAQAFLEGVADVDPREYPSTCEHCALPGLCRVREFPPTVLNEDADEATEEAGNG